MIQTLRRVHESNFNEERDHRYMLAYKKSHNLGDEQEEARE